MSFLERIQLASEEGWGAVLYFIVAFLIGLVLLYGLIMSYKRKKSSLSAKDQAYLDRNMSLLKASSYKASTKQALMPFGTIINCIGQDQVLCEALILNQHTATKEFWDSIELYAHVINEELTNFTELYSFIDEDLGVLLQTIDRDQWKSIRYYLMDREMSLFEKETLLLQLALIIAAFHAMDPIADRKIFHGYLNPDTILVHLDDRDCIQQLCIKDHGVMWAMDHSLWLNSVNKIHPKKGISFFSEKLRYSAPELLESGSSLTEALDFFSFGKMAFELFNKGNQEQNFDCIPKRWRDFVKKCLKHDIKERPTDFLELDDLLNDPEINAHFEEVEKKQADLGSIQLTPLKNARELFLKLRNKQSLGAELEDNPQISKGFTFLRNRQWGRAVSLFKGLEKEDPSSRVLLGLAIGLHQKGERDLAEKAYMSLKEQDPELVSEFHHFLAKGF